jgi:hypothetical protein
MSANPGHLAEPDVVEFSTDNYEEEGYDTKSGEDHLWKESNSV